MTIPEQIRRQSEVVAKHFEEQKTQTGTTEVAVEPEGQTQESVQQTDSAEDTAAAPVLNEQKTTGNKDNEETYEKRYKTLQGMYNADTVRLRAENQQLNQRLTQMEQLLSTLSTPSAPAVAADRKLITDKDVERCRDIVESRLEHTYTLESWLESKGCVNHYFLCDRATKDRIQEHRHAWLDLLIAEFKSKGD